jgi:hypothetical protein
MTKQGTGQCAFCGGRGITKEHIIAGWIKRLLPTEEKHFRFRGARSGEGPSKRTQLRLSQGSAFNAHTRKVCGKCNNGWMNDLEKRVQPILIPLIRGEKVVLQPEAQLILAGWIAKTVMTANTVYPESNAITQFDRSIVMATSRPLDNWQIWLALHHNKEWRTGLDHIGVALHRKADYEKNKNKINTQSTTIGLGSLLIHAFSSALPSVRFNPSPEFGTRLHRVWPQTNEKISWPPTSALSDEDVERLGRHLYTHFSPHLRAL